MTSATEPHSFHIKWYIAQCIPTCTNLEAGEARLTSVDLSARTDIVIGQLGGRPRIL
jgi:hypothetical protein